MEKKSRKSKNSKSLTKRKVIIILAFILIIIGIVFLINRLIPIKDISSDNIKISLSTTKTTGKSVTATIATTTPYDIYYYLSEKDEETENLTESNYYEDILNDDNNETSNTTNTNSVSNSSETTNSENSTNNNLKDNSENIVIENINDNQYSKMNGNSIDIEKNGTVYLKYGRFGKLSKNPYVFSINNIDKTGPEIGEIETSSTDSTISVKVQAVDLKSTNLTYYFKLADDTNYECTDSNNSYIFTDLTENETYTIYVKVKDEYGNETEAVTDAIASSKVTTAEKKAYYFKVNLAANTVTVYDKDENGKYTEPIKAMICSTGKATPKSGVYKISYKYRWLALFGNVYGQYAVRIHGNILFHSVPYTDTYPDTLEYEEYDKLGTSASAGCIRLTVKDAKWIYDNAASGSQVEFYSDSKKPGPLGKPTAQKISSNKLNRNWDPTDPDQRNPWLGGTGKVSKNNTTTTNTTSNTTKNNTINNKTTNQTNNNNNNTLIWDTRD